jgi:hypothetical protein
MVVSMLPPANHNPEPMQPHRNCPDYYRRRVTRALEFSIQALVITIIGCVHSPKAVSPFMLNSPKVSDGIPPFWKLAVRPEPLVSHIFANDFLSSVGWLARHEGRYMLAGQRSYSDSILDT